MFASLRLLRFARVSAALVALITLFVGLATPARAAFTHPGGLHTQTDLDRMKSQVAAGAHPWIDDWNLLIQDPLAQSTYTATPLANMGASRQNADKDAHAAYLNAIRWYISGDTAYADCAVRILNGWAQTVNQYPSGADTPGLIGIPIQNFALAGEVLRIYPGWSQSDFTAFKAMFANYCYPVVNDFLTNHNGQGPTHYWTNWDACNIGSLLAMGVLCDNQSWFDQGVTYYQTGIGAGAINNAVVAQFPGNLYSETIGQWQESGRDQSHSQLGLGLLGYACQTAWNQGVDLFSFSSNRFLSGAEYVAQYNLWHDVPYTEYINSDPTVCHYVARNFRGQYGDRPVYELLYNHYAVQQGLYTPNVKAMAQLQRPEGGSNDHFGYGTLTFTQLASASPYPVLPAPAAPIGLTATASVGAVWLSWTPPPGDVAAGYNVLRATTSGGPYTTIQSATSGTKTDAAIYTDTNVSNGTTYYYVVQAVNQSGTSASSAEVSALPVNSNPLAGGWADADIGTVTTPGSATCSAINNNTFLVAGSGSDIAGSADSFHYVYQSITGDFTFIGRLASETLSNSSADKIGLMMRESLDPGSRQVALILYSNSGGKQQVSYRANTNGSTSSIVSQNYVYAPQWFKLVRAGDTFTGSISLDGTTWVTTGTVTVSMAANCYAGIAVCSRSTTGGLTSGVMDNVTSVGTLPNPPVITSASATTTTVGNAFNYQITATASPTSYGATGLPAGLTVDATNGLISGAATVSGTYNTTISATNSSGTTSATLIITVNPAVATNGTWNSTAVSPLTLNLTFTASSANIAYTVATTSPVPASTVPVVGDAIRVNTTVGNFSNSTAYYVVAVNTTTSTIQLATSPTGTAQTPSAGGTSVAPIYMRWSNAVNWTGGQIANGYGAVATISSLPSNVRIALAGNWILGTLNFTGGGGSDLDISGYDYATTGGGSLTFATGTSTTPLFSVGRNTTFPVNMVGARYIRVIGSQGLEVMSSSDATTGTTVSWRPQVGIDWSQFSGDLQLRQGRLDVQANNVLPSNSNLVLGNGNTTTGRYAVFSLFSGRSQVIGALSGTTIGRVTAGTSSLTTAGTALTLTIGGNNGSGLFAGIIGADAAGSSLNTTPISIIKNGTGTQVFSGANVYTGTTTINNGTFLLNGSVVSPLVVNAGTFGGNGSSSNTVTIGTGSGAGAVLAPGSNGLGTFTTTGALTLRADATLALDFSPSTNAADKVVANGVTLNNALLSTNIIGPNAAISGGAVFTIISNTSASAVSGTFNGLPEGSTVTVGVNACRISYVGGDGNDVTLTVLGAAQPPVITSTSATGAYGSSFSFAIAASNTPTSFSATGLPAGLTINPSTGVISGIPLAGGTFTATITATNAAGSTTAPLTISIPTVVGVNLRAYNTYGMPVTDVAGVVRATYWNNLVGPGTTGETVSTSTLANNLGIPVSGMTVSFTAGTTGGSYTNSGTLKFGTDAVTVNPATNDPNLYSSAFDQYDGTPGTLSVTGVPYGTYDVIFYVYDGGSSQGGTITANGQTRAIRGGVGNPDVNGLGYIQSSDTVNTSGTSVQQGNYVRFSGLSGDLNASFVATNMGSGTLRLKITGFQILGNDTVAAPSAAPPAPATLTASGGNTQVALNWALSATATSYKIYKNGAPLATVASPLTSYADTAVVNGSAYSYTVSAVNSIGEGGQSATASATPLAPAFTLAKRTVYQYSVPMAPIYGSWPYDPQRRAYLWVPPGTTKIQGVVFGLHNMLEKPMFDDPVIRQACAEANLAIVFVSPGDSKTWTPNGVGNYTAGKLTTAIDLDPNNYVSADINPATGTNYATDINPATGTRFTNQAEQAGFEVAALLNKLATESGFTELQSAPILFAGHSAASTFVWTRSVYTTTAMNGRVFAILPYKGTFPGSVAANMPVFHTASEWQEISSWGNTWELGDAPQLRALRAGGTTRLVGGFVQPGTGHYEYDETQSGPIALFIKKAAQYRIPANWTSSWTPGTFPTLNTIDPTSGYLVDVTKLGSGNAQPVAYNDWIAAGKDPLRAYWYFDQESAQAVCDVQNAGFSKRPQMINAFQNATTLASLANQTNGTGYVSLSATLQSDGVTFKVQGASMNQSPVSRLFNGAALGMPSGSIQFKANGSGALKQTSVDTFQVWMDRGTVIKEGQPWEPFIIATQAGDANYRRADRPIWVNTSVPVNNINGTAQTVTFPTVPDQIVGHLQNITLNATASSGLPVQYWVVSGPYRNDENNSAVLIPDQMPANPTLPIRVVVGAWQWGRAGTIAAATPVYQEFHIIAPPPLPGAPSSLAASTNGPQFTLTWAAAANASTYSVKRAVVSGGPYAAIASGISGTSYVDLDVVYGTTYYYVVSATNVTGEGAASAEIPVSASATKADGTWTQAGTTTKYSDLTNWTNGVAANGTGALMTVSKAGPTIVLDTNITLGALTGSWASGASMNLSGVGKTLTLASANGTPTFTLSNWFSRYDYLGNLNLAGSQGFTYIGKSNVLVLQSGLTWNGFSGGFTIAPATDGSMVFAQAPGVLPPVDVTLTPGTGTNGYRHAKLVLNGGADQTIGALNSSSSSTATAYVSSYSAPSLLTGAAPLGTNTVGFATLTIGAGNGSGEFRGKIGTGFNNSANAEDATASLLDIVKVGTGTQVFSGTNNYVGSTEVQAGTLLVNGTHAPTGLGVLGAYDVFGTLGGSGTIKPAADFAGAAMIGINSGGVLAPGGQNVDANADRAVDATGTILMLDQSASQRGVLAFASGGHLRVTLGDNLTSTRLIISGQANSAVPAVTFAGAVVDLVDLMQGTLAPGQYVLIHSDGSGTYAGLTVAGDGTVTDGLSLGAGFSAYPGSTFKVVGNDLVVSLAPPQITSAAAAGGTYQGALTYTITASPAATSFAATGLPAGLTLDSVTGVISGAPTDVGTFVVTVSATNAGGTTSTVITLTIAPAPVTITLGHLNTVYSGIAQAATVTTSPANVAVNVTYDGGPTLSVAAGTYAVSAVSADAHYTGAVSGTLTIAKAAPTIAVTPYSLAYDGSVHTAAGSAMGVEGEGLVGLDLSGTRHTTVGSYADTWEFTDVTGNYLNASGSVGDAITPADATIAVTPYNVTYDKQPHTATGTVTGVNGEALSGLDLSGTTHTKAGTYQDTWVFTDATGNYANATGAITDVIAKAGAKLTLAALTQGYDGTPRTATVVTEPAELGVTVNYDGNSAAPIYPGSYLVTATIDDPNYSGSATDTLRVRATARIRGELAIAGELDGSVQLVAAVDRDLEGNATLTGDVLLPGLPQVKVAGTPTYAGVSDASGASTPADYTFALKGRAVARYIVRRVDAGAWPVVTAPTASTGTRSVTLNWATDEIGESVTLRALTLNGNAGTVTLPGGAYDTLTVNGGSTLVLGSADAASPAVYDVQRLILNGSATVKIAGPVILKLGHELTVNGTVGATEHPEWLDLQVASDGVTLNSRAILHGSVTAPSGRVTINGHATLCGYVRAADLTINGNGRLVDPANDVAP